MEPSPPGSSGATSTPTTEKATLLLGTLEESKGDIDKAMTLYKKTLDLIPNQPVASNNLAYLMMENGGNLDVALSLAQTAKRAYPDSPSASDTLAWAYYHKGTYASAQDLLEDAAKSDPNDPNIQYHLGMVYLKQGDKANAATHLKKAVALAPQSRAGTAAASALPQAS